MVEYQLGNIFVSVNFMKKILKNKAVEHTNLHILFIHFSRKTN